MCGLVKIKLKNLTRKQLTPENEVLKDKKLVKDEVTRRLVSGVQTANLEYDSLFNYEKASSNRDFDLLSLLFHRMFFYKLNEKLSGYECDHTFRFCNQILTQMKFNKGGKCMGFRFYKRVNILPGVSMNFSKSGPSFSFGPRGMKYTVGPKGTRTTFGIPGTGLYYTTTSSHKRKSGGTQTEELGQKAKAKKGYQDIYMKKPNYEDVAARLEII